MRSLHPITTAPMLLALLAFTLGADECTSNPSPGPGACLVDGTWHEDGTTGIPASDGCNTCVCEDGGLSCTEIACAPAGACLGGDGIHYANGSHGVPALDGCNTCSCVDGELTICTEIACPPPGSDCVGPDGTIYPDGSTGVPSPDGCNTCVCDAGTITGCTEIACPPTADCSVFGVLYSDGHVPAPDGCNSCGCEDGAATAVCTEAACGPIPIVECDDLPTFMSLPYDLGPVTIDGDTLSATVSYSGGCAPHYFRLCYERGFLESFPVQVNVRIDHDTPGDDCEAYPTEVRAYDLTPLRDAYRAGYGSDHGDMILRLGDGVTYSF